MTKIFLSLITAILILLSNTTFAFINKSAMDDECTKANFIISKNGYNIPIVASSNDWPGVLKVLKIFQADITRVTDVESAVHIDNLPQTKEMIIVGTIGYSSIIAELIDKNKIDVTDINGKWDSYLRMVVEKPFDGVERALVIAGSNKRGTVYGMFDLSKEIGVSPWYWWADVPVKKNNIVSVRSNKIIVGEPKVKYRGIFLNDEAPALSGWAYEKFGGFNSKFYEHVFELLLRLKGNFLWPAMWGRMFYVEDNVNPKLADEYGIVIGTSHHEPMMRAHQEWAEFGNGKWNYETNDSALRKFWREGIARMGNYESIITLAMRGDGDEAMSPTANVELLERIVRDQRKIIREVTGKKENEIPQVWALYKEVQEYYDKGMRVPDDVTLLLCDDNWGNIRKLPNLNEKPHKGGYGIYYHYDFVGGPRNYKWLNTTQIERVWEQMNLAYQYGADRIWIVNVGDLKPMEFPIDFFLEFAWNPEKITADNLPEFSKKWAATQFGEKYANEVADILNSYTKFNSRRKPESLSHQTYSLINYREFENVVDEYKKLEARAQRIYDEVPNEYKDAFYQLVLHPVQACSNLNELYLRVAQNKFYASQGRVSTNYLAYQVDSLFKRDELITEYYHKKLSGGKWNHFMSQTHLGYTSWQQPDRNIMPDIETIDLPENASMGVSVEGSDKWWPNEKGIATLPEFDKYNKQTYYVEIFNRGKKAFDYKIIPESDWIEISSISGKIINQKRIWINIDWKKAPSGKTNSFFTIKNEDEKLSVKVKVEINNPEFPEIDTKKNMFIEANGYVSIDAENYTNKISTYGIDWKIIQNLGRTASSIAPFPVTAQNIMPANNSPRLEYKIYLFNKGNIDITVSLSPTLNFGYSEGIRFAVSVDDGEPVIINMHAEDKIPDFLYPNWWNEAVLNNIRSYKINAEIDKTGEHIIKFWYVDPGIVLQKIIIETEETKPSYLGPLQSFNGFLSIKN